MAESGPIGSTGFTPPKHSKREKVRPEINVTPLVDVVLVLLIIFMVVTPELEKGGRLTLPMVQNPDPESKKKEDGITVTVSQDGRVFLDADEIPRSELVAKLEGKIKVTPGKKLYLKGDDSRPYGEMRDLFRDLQKLGFTGVRLLVSAPTAQTSEAP